MRITYKNVHRVNGRFHLQGSLGSHSNHYKQGRGVMSNDNDDDLYNEDFSEEEQEFPRRGETPDVGDGGDEQQAQKVNGKLEALRSEIESLSRSLDNATQKIKDLSEDNSRLEKDNARIASAYEQSKASSVSSGGGDGDGKAAAELVSLKKKNESLKEQLDSALSVNPATCPHGLKQEFMKLCKGNEKFQNLKDKDLTVEMCIKILKAQKSKNADVLAPGSALDGGASVVSAVSAADSMTSKRIKQLEHELKLTATSNTNDVQGLRDKVIHMNERIRIEKEHKYRAEEDLKTAQKKIDMLGSHMEKLILHLKHEGAHKLRLAEQLRVSERANNVLTEKNDLISRKSAAKDRLILELREGSKVLEDQLRLMDEKYMELRTKLDYARELGVKKIKKAEKTASELRIKFAMYNGSAILDAIPLPTEQQQQGYSSGGDPWAGSNNQYGGLNGGGSGLMPPGDMRQGSSPTSRRSRGNRGNSNLSVSSSMNSLPLGSISREPTMDGVLEKIRKQEGRKQDWTAEKLKNLANGKRTPS